MSTIRLVNCDMPYKNIMQGSKRIGRVYKNDSGDFTATIGHGPNAFEATASTEHEAFVRAVTLHMQSARRLAPMTAEELAMREQIGRTLGGEVRQVNRGLDYMRILLGTITGNRRRH